MGTPNYDFTRKFVPYERWRALSKHAQRITSLVAAREGEMIPGVGFIHPDGEERRKVIQADLARRARAERETKTKGAKL